MTNDHNKLNVNINDVALIFEGGGMRASYTAGAVVTLLENNLNFGDVYGISAGSSPYRQLRLARYGTCEDVLR